MRVRTLPARFRSALARLARARAGNAAGVVALLTPVAVTLVLGATDVAAILGDKQRMQSIAEASAIAGARNLSVAMSESDALEHAGAMAEAMVSEWRGSPTITVTPRIVSLDHGAKGVRVRLDAHRPSFFNDLLPPGGWRYDTAATASSVGASPLCVLGFAENLAINLLQTAQIVAPDCLVHSNGNVFTGSSARIEAGRTQAVKDARGNISPEPVLDAPPINDPFESLALEASLVKCVGKLLGGVTLGVYTTGTHHLAPGDHCGAITISGDATLILEPGEHRFGGGAMILTDNARLIGEDVVLIVDLLWRTSFLGNSTVSLSGRREGLLAGFVMIADRDNVQPFQIDTNHVERLDGVIYIPNAQLRVGSSGDVARQSDWTVIVAESLYLSGNPNLFINADYAGSDINPPGGVGPRRDAVRLVE